MRRLVLPLWLVLVLVVLPAAAASAAGVGGVDLTPVWDSGRQILEVGAEPSTHALRLRNTEDEAREVQLYAVAVHRAGPGDYALGGRGSAGWIRLDETVRLAPQEERTVSYTVIGHSVPDQQTHVAFVIEADSDSTLVTRAAEIVPLRVTGALGLPIAPFVVAVLLLLALLAAHLARRRLETRTRRPAASPTPTAAAA